MEVDEKSIKLDVSCMALLGVTGHYRAITITLERILAHFRADGSSINEPSVGCVFITGEGESQNKEKQIWSYEERR